MVSPTCPATTYDRASRGPTRCCLAEGHEGAHSDGGGLDWYNPGNTSATPTTPDLQGYEKALAAAKAIGPVPPPVTFYEVAGGVGAFLGDEPVGWMTRVQFEELKKRLGGSADGR